VTGPLLAAALIVENEAEMLPACRQSLAGVVDEIHAYDTGSVDGCVRGWCPAAAPSDRTRAGPQRAAEDGPTLTSSHCRSGRLVRRNSTIRFFAAAVPSQAAGFHSRHVVRPL
jgi:hypothetical protein